MQKKKLSRKEVKDLINKGNTIGFCGLGEKLKGQKLKTDEIYSILKDKNTNEIILSTKHPTTKEKHTWKLNLNKKDPEMIEEENLLNLFHLFH